MQRIWFINSNIRIFVADDDQEISRLLAIAQKREEFSVTCVYIHKGLLVEEIEFEELQKKSRNYIELRTDDDRKASFLLETKLGIKDYRVMDQSIICV